jgi:hypothetical protein
VSFVDADIETDPSELLGDALDQYNALLETAGMPGWDAEDADAAVILLKTIAQIAADNATVASTVLPAIFRAFGTQLVNLAYEAGAKAMVDSTWTFTSPAPLGGYTIGAGTAVLIDGETFYVSDEVDVVSGATSATVLLVASDTGTAYNGLGGINAGAPDVMLNDELDWVSTVTTASVTSGGADQQDDDDYLDSLQAYLALQSARPITEPNFADIVVSPLAVNQTGVAVGRATAIAGYWPVARTLSTGGTGPAPLTLTGSLTSGSPTVTVSAEPYFGAIPYPGSSVTGTGVAGSTTVAPSPAPTSASFTMSANATAPESAETITVGAFSNVGGAITVFVTDVAGNALTNTAMDTLETWLTDNYLLQGVYCYIEPPSYNAVYVTAQVHPLPGFDATAVASSVQSTLIGYLNPGTWGNPGSASTGSANWYNAAQGFNYVRYDKVIGVIQNVQGVDYLINGSLKLGFSASPTGTSDLLMTGPAPLPTSTTSTILVTGV